MGEDDHMPVLRLKDGGKMTGVFWIWANPVWQIFVSPRSKSAIELSSFD